jgi:hypothetical protein
MIEGTLYSVRPDAFAAKWFDGTNAQAIIDWASQVALPGGSADNYGAHMSVDADGTLQFDDVVQRDTAIWANVPGWIVMLVRRTMVDSSGLPVPDMEPRATLLTPLEFDAYMPLP